MMAGRSLSRLLLVACLLADAILSEVSVTLAAHQRSPRVAEQESTKSGAGGDSAQGDVRGSPVPRTPAEFLRSPQVRFSEIVDQDIEIVSVDSGSGGGAESPIADAARYDVGPALTPRDFARGMEQQQTAASVPLVAGRTDPIELAGQFEGDIVLTDTDVQAVTNGAVPGRRIWPKGVIRYAIASGFSRSERGVIAAAIHELERRTCVGVYPVPPGTPRGDFVHIVRDHGCSSAVGRLGGNQTLSLSEGCFTRGVVLHQLLHAAGLWHEQSRPDRHQHVRVLSENVAPGRLFELLSYARQPSPPASPSYQRRSLMHLSRWAFATDRSRPTLESISNPSEPLGQRDGMTPEDALAVNLLYGCKGDASPPLPAPPAADSSCANKNNHCDWWARHGECKRNPGYMYNFCAKACLKCTGTSCENLHRSCSMWAALDRCSRNASYMHVYCRRACDLCRPAPQQEQEQPPPCLDGNKHCAEWARSGHCNNYFEYMAEYCLRSCGYCH